MASHISSKRTRYDLWHQTESLNAKFNALRLPCEAFCKRSDVAVEDASTHKQVSPKWFPHNFAKNHRYFFTVTNVWRLTLVNATETADIWRRHTQDISVCASARGPFVTREGSVGCQVMPLDTFSVAGLDASGYWQVNMYLFSLAVGINCSHATEAVVSREVKEGY